MEWLKQQLQPELALKNLHKNNTVLIPAEWRLDKEKLTALAKEQGIDAGSPPARALLAKANLFDPWLLCNGHTLIEILEIGLRNGALANHKMTVSEKIASYLRAAIGKDELYQTKLCQAIFRWQDRHPPYTILERTVSP